MPINVLARDFFFAGCVCIVLKLVAAVVQIALARGNYRTYPDTSFFRVVYIIGKVTPAMAALFLFVFAVLGHDRKHSWEYGGAAIFAALLAAWVVRLRKQGRFFGVLDAVSHRRENT